MHKLGSRRELGFASFRKDTLKLAAEISGAAYRIRTYDPRITKADIATGKALEFQRICHDLVCRYAVDPWPTQLHQKA